MDSRVIHDAELLFEGRQTFVLDDADWLRFDAALRRPAVDQPRLRALMETPGVLG